MLVLNEQKYAEDLYYDRNDDVKSLVTKMGYITRYQLYVLGFNDVDNYKYAVKWANKYHNNFDEASYSNLIADAVKRAHKKSFYNIDSLKITQSELDIISSLNNLRAEKILFVLLCMAKQQSVSYGFTDGLVKYSLPDLCKAARISVPTDEREYILYNIIQHGFLGYPKKNNTQCLIVNFIDNDNEAVLNINEVDCQELAYVYLYWKNNGNGYARCEYCKKLIKQSKTNPKRFCKTCSSIVGEVPDDKKVISCIDCGKPVYVSALNTKTCRCDECQDKYRKEYMRKFMQEKRINQSSC